LRVPLIVRLPALLRSRSVVPRRVSDIVRLVDVTPTVLDLLGLPTLARNGDRQIDGVSLLDRMRGTRRTSELEAYAESLYLARFGWSPLKTMHDGRFKLIDAPPPELYDLERDPFEERNIYTERPTIADAMRRRLTQMSPSEPSDASDGLTPADELSPDARERLHALGYIGTQPLAASHPGDDRPDPKDRMRTSALHHRAEFRNCEEFR
jgi:arylsulfatase A-like enzyme